MAPSPPTLTRVAAAAKPATAALPTPPPAFTEAELDAHVKAAMARNKDSCVVPNRLLPLLVREVSAAASTASRARTHATALARRASPPAASSPRRRRA